MGSGNYHYISYLLMLKIKKPFTLILFDHHTDMVKPIHNSIISCGSWVLNAIYNVPMLAKVIIVGVRKDLAEAIPSIFNDKVKVFTKDDLLANKNIDKDIVFQINTSTVYISVDKDVLSESDVIVNWDQGNMRLKQLIGILKYIENYKEIAGIDVCGEYIFTPVEAFFQETKKAVKVNNKANSLILKAIMDLD